MPIGLKAPRSANGCARRALGFTLIELMITVAVVAILAMVAMPSYRDYIRRSTRAEAQAYLMAAASRQQQFLLDTRAYAGTVGAIGVPVPAKVAGAYTVSLETAGGPPPTFTLTATPTADQSSEKCGTLTIDQAGAKGAATAGCW